MASPKKIAVTSYLTAVTKSKKAAGAPRLRYRWRAEFVGGIAVGNFTGPDDAIGALIRAAVGECTSPDDVVDFVASLFGDLDVRTADVTLGRAVRLAARNPNRKNPGALVAIYNPLPIDPAPRLDPPAGRPAPNASTVARLRDGAARRKGGAA